jgi:tryptophan synthase alpha chain
MNLQAYLHQRLQTKKLLLMAHAIVGYPSLEANWRMLEILQEAGVDLVELQMPFSEPIADGPLFVQANEQALKSGVHWPDYFDLMHRAAQTFDYPLLMMGYCNTAFVMGYDAFAERLAKSGGTGYIIPDLPFEEFGDLFSLSAQRELHPILICTPTNTEERLKAICEHGSGMLYCVARKGVTGKSTELDSNVGAFLKRCRSYSPLPLGLGFGLSTPEDLRQIHGLADVAIVGSALLRAWESGGENAYRDYVHSLVDACQG